MEEQLSQNYEKMDESYGGYTTNISKNGNKVVSEVEIDYEHMDVESLLEDQPSMKNYANDNNQLTLEGVKTIYKAMGATCEE